ncbi:hypothetical protein IA57_00945 [Mangrovimonas yunxiaonensis]|uniref:DUF3307 domain-containing protein n=1 Tax=Mangrovimonas yunxiaonensis TaxID=1197477 RepID=A0A084TNE9_9FLAO|nr:DUF3307 domain-containing protein [Mangrovimonas yunxiaonensis]KFB02235.1 hypothetical protein IA57_00945 [Mangrovimonas yunxiaonensis]GGH39123.1 membrane protein [Mangrovimonas yunxiaonensis]
MILLTQLILAHLIGDFLLQPKKWVKEKEKRTLRSPKFYVHIAIHLGLLFLITWNMALAPFLVAIGISHGLIDAAKLLLQKQKNKRFWFFLDQFLHLIVILGAWYIATKPEAFLSQNFNLANGLAIVTAVIFLTKPTSIIMQVIFSKWQLKKLTAGNESLKDAGKYIGILERLLVFAFIITDHWEAVGFLITAKSVFRFGDLQESKQRKLTEYVLIGTLISFGIAIVTGLLYNSLKV